MKHRVPDCARELLEWILMFNNAKVDSWFGLDTSVGSGKPQLLPDDQLRAAMTTKGSIAIVRVSDAVVQAEGMGNERVSISASVDKVVFGRPMIHLEMTRTGRYPGVVRGQRYVVAVSGTGELLGYAPVPGDLERTLEGHRRVVERLVLGR